MSPWNSWNVCIQLCFMTYTTWVTQRCTGKQRKLCNLLSPRHFIISICEIPSPLALLLHLPFAPFPVSPFPSPLLAPFLISPSLFPLPVTLLVSPLPAYPSSSPPHSWTLPALLPLPVSPSQSTPPHCLSPPPPPCPSHLPVHPPLDHYHHLHLHLTFIKKLPAPQSMHATTIIEFFLIYMTFEGNGTYPTFIIRWSYIYPPNFSPLGLAVWPSIDEQIDR